MVLFLEVLKWEVETHPYSLSSLCGYDDFRSGISKTRVQVRYACILELSFLDLVNIQKTLKVVFFLHKDESIDKEFQNFPCKSWSRAVSCPALGVATDRVGRSVRL